MAGAIAPYFLGRTAAGRWRTASVVCLVATCCAGGLTAAESAGPEQQAPSSKYETAPQYVEPQYDYGPPAGTLASAGGAGIPFFMGDSPVSACGGVNSGSAIIGHPTFACSRLNVAENGTPLPQDRLFFNYRHYADATTVKDFTDDAERQLDFDSYTFGFEKTAFDGLASMEVRIPFNGQLISDINFNAQADPLSQRNFELGNIGLAFKVLLQDRGNWITSAGLGLALPTARSVIVRTQGDVGVAVNDATGSSTTATIDNFGLLVHVPNESVYLLPFLGWAYAPQSRFFHQGFAQVDVATTSTRPTVSFLSGDMTVNGNTVFAEPAFGRAFSVHPQTLGRLNLQFGYWLTQEGLGRIRSAAAVMEVNYTTTLNNATVARATLFQRGSELERDFDLEMGNTHNRVDIVNMGFGLPVWLGLTQITPGFVVPLSTGDNKPFDYEIALLINRTF
jgi:hypothetical protein